MRKRISIHITNFLPGNGSVTDTSRGRLPTVDVCEEYANAFRTESYIDFWTRVLTLSSYGDSATCVPAGASTCTAARLSSYRLFAEHLLDPDQPSVTRILKLAKHHHKNHILLSDYFSQTEDASILCGILLKDVDHTRAKYRALKTFLQSLERETTKFSSPANQARLSELSESFNPFISSSCRFQVAQAGCFRLLKRLESGRDKAQAKLRLINKAKRGSAIFLVALTISLTVVVAAHALALLVAAPCLITSSLKLKGLTRVSAQLDAAAKGTYILNRDLDTVSRLVARLNDELEHMCSMVRFWLMRGDDRLQTNCEVVRLLKKNDSSFRQQLDELEEHLYLCFMTINRARNLVIQEILDPHHRVGPPTVFPK